MRKVAIITRTKDRPIFLKRSLVSVASQTYQDYVHVIINDGGKKSDIESIVSGMSSEQKDKTKIFHRDISSNAPDTIFNESIDRVDSEYIALHDDDDTWHPEFLERTVEVLERGARGVVVRTDKIVEAMHGNNLKLVKRTRYMPDMIAVSLYRQYIDNQLTPISFIYRRDSYNSVGKYDSSLPVVGDWEFGIRFLQKYDVEYIDPGFALAYYHHRKQKGDNSFAKHSHRQYVTKVANSYLRKEISEGYIGAGYIVSKLKYDQDIRHGLMKKIIPKSAIDWLRK